MYDSSTARFLTEDPIRYWSGDANLYRYCQNDPVNRVDPNGLASRKTNACENCAVSIFFPLLFDYDTKKIKSLLQNVTINDDLTQDKLQARIAVYIALLLSNKEFKDVKALVELEILISALMEQDAITFVPLLTSTGAFEINTKQKFDATCNKDNTCGDVGQLSLVLHELTHVAQAFKANDQGVSFLKSYPFTA